MWISPQAIVGCLLLVSVLSVLAIVFDFSGVRYVRVMGRWASGLRLRRNRDPRSDGLDPWGFRRRSPFFLLAVLAGLYPIGVILWWVTTWLVAGLFIGHLPIAWVDDPNNIPGPVVTALRKGSFLQINMAVPMFVANAVFSVVAAERAAREKERRFQRVFLPVILSFFTWSCGLLFFLLDPLDMVRWLIG